MTRASGTPSTERRLILVRHGVTAWNTEGRYTTRSDIPLSDAGIAQAQAAAAALASGAHRPRLLLAARTRPQDRRDHRGRPERRAPPPLQVDERLTEIDAGPFEGLTAAEINAGPLAEAHTLWHSDTDPVTPPGAETLESARDRAAAFFADVSALPGTTLAATHGSLARVLVASVVLGAPPPAHRRLWLDNCHWVDDPVRPPAADGGVQPGPARLMHHRHTSPAQPAVLSALMIRRLILLTVVVFAVLATASPASAASSTNITKALQRKLIRLKYLQPGLATGNYGLGTIQAVMAFQGWVRPPPHRLHGYRLVRRPQARQGARCRGDTTPSTWRSTRPSRCCS